MPRGIPDNVRVDSSNPVQSADSGANSGGDRALHRATRRRERVGDSYCAPSILDLIHEAKPDDVETQFGIDHGAQRGPDFLYAHLFIRQAIASM